MLLVLGNACLDITHRLERLPRAGETTNALGVVEDLGGKGLNQAIAAARAGATLRFVAPVGTDEAALRIRALLESEGISPSDLLPAQGRSDRSMIMIDRHGENVIVTDAARAQGLDFKVIADRLSLSSSDAMLLQGNLSASLSAAALDAAGRQGARIIINPAPFVPAFSQFLQRSDVVILNAIEAMQWTGAPSTAEALDQISNPLTIITLGSKGCLLKHRGGPCISIAAPAVMAVDSVGAGDVFVGTFAAEWLATDDPVRAARLATAAASLKVQRTGTLLGFPTRDEVIRLRDELGRAQPV